MNTIFHKKLFSETLLGVLIIGFSVFVSLTIVVNAQSSLGKWQSFIKSGKTFSVLFDVSKFDDSGWKGASDPMGTLMAGKKYSVRYDSGSSNWTVTGWNEAANGSITVAYKTQKPEDFKLNMWGRVYTFANDGTVIDPQYGLVGHLLGLEEEKNRFPVVELGNCKSEAECKKFCDDSQNTIACVGYAEKNGLISKEQAEKAREFQDVLKGEGPGGCKDQKSCENYCNDISKGAECISFAKKHNLIPADQLADAERIAKALGEGAKLPGGCKDKKSCENYCADPSKGEECLSFAEKAGFVSKEDAVQARKVLPLIAKGESPGKCKTKQECESYCAVEGNMVECANFAEKAGFMSKEEAEMVRKTGGKGPGGCRSKETCESYCNEVANQAVCLDFAQKHNLIPEEKLKEIKEGMGRLRGGIKQIPASGINCLKSELGDDIVNKIEDGSFMPTQKMGEQIRTCMAKMMPEIKEKINEGLKMAGPETTACLKSKLGEDGMAKVLAGEIDKPETGDVLKTCFEAMKTEGLKKMRDGLKKMPPEARKCIEDKLGAGLVSKVEAGEDVDIGPETGKAFQECASAIAKSFEGQLQKAPPEIQSCIKDKVGDFSKLTGPEAVQGAVEECMKNFKPQGMPDNIPGDDYRPEGVPEGGAPAGVPEGKKAPTAEEKEAIMMKQACPNLAMAPSCDYVPENMRELCRKCKAGN